MFDVMNKIDKLNFQISFEVEMFSYGQFKYLNVDITILETDICRQFIHARLIVINKLNEKSRLTEGLFDNVLK